MSIVGAIFSILIATALGYAALRAWRQSVGQEATGQDDGFLPDIGFTQLDGMVSLSLLLDNESPEYVWVEEIEIFLSGLKAEDQATEPSFHGIQKIRQVVRPDDLLPISLCATIYKAAGEPQRKYFCVMSSVLRYRIGEEWFEKKLKDYRLRMMGLMATRIHRERNPVPPFQVQERIPEYSRQGD